MKLVSTLSPAEITRLRLLGEELDRLNHERVHGATNEELIAERFAVAARKERFPGEDELHPIPSSAQLRREWSGE